jgi:CDP-diacylglycerol--glycerol-3-phosphate 3-phosphatidyltransferase
MTIYDLKPQFQNLLRPLVRVLWQLKITPNQITIVTCLLSIAVGLMLYFTETAETFLILPFFLRYHSFDTFNSNWPFGGLCL